MKRKSKIKKTAAFLAALILMILSLCQAVFAADTAGIDSAKPVSLLIDLEAQNKCASVSLYRVGEWDGSLGKYVLTQEFAESNVKIDVLTTEEMLTNSKTLAKYAADKKLQAAASKVTEKGKAQFTNLKSGLYLVCQRRGTADNVTMSPFLTTLPVLDQVSYAWNYDVKCYPKKQSDSPGGGGSDGGGGSSGGGGGSPSGGSKKTESSSGETSQSSSEPEDSIEMEPEGLPLFALPKTGDDSVSYGLLIGAMILAVFGGGFAFRKMKEN